MKKKKLVGIILAVVVVLCVFGGINGAKDKGTSEKSSKEASAEVADEAKTEEPKEDEQSTEEKIDDGIIDFTTEKFNVKYVKHEKGTDFEGNPCLYYYYTFTNNSDKNATPGVTANVQCFQNGGECQIAIVTDASDSAANYSGETQPGATVEVCQTFQLKDDSEVTIEASDLISFDDEKDTQKISLQ